MTDLEKSRSDCENRDQKRRRKEFRFADRRMRGANPGGQKIPENRE